MRRMHPRVSILIILAAAFASCLLSVALWFGIIVDPDREGGLFVGLWVTSILALGTLLTPRGGPR
jgi:hypothetical protein